MKSKPKKQKAKPVYGWAIVSPENVFYLWSISLTKREAVFQSENSSDRHLINSWKELKNLKYRLVKVKIEEV